MRRVHIKRGGGFASVVVAASLWGTIGVATQAIFAVDSASPLFVNLARMAIATPVLALICWRMIGRRMFVVRRRDLSLMALSGALIALSQAAYYSALRLVGVSVATLLAVCVAPVIVTALSVALRYETFSAKTVVALVCAVVGSVLLVGRHGEAESSANNVVLGTLLSLVAAVTYAGTIVCGRFLASDSHPLQVMTVMFGVGTVTILLLGSTSGITALNTALGWMLVLYLGLVPTACAYTLFQVGLRSVPAIVASIVAMLEPLVAAILAWGFLGETLPTTGIVGAALLMLSILLLSTNEVKEVSAV